MAKRNKKKKKMRLLPYISKFFKSVSAKRENEYSKRLLSRIVNSSILMMWGTYVLAWYGKVEIAETLSKTIATSIISVVVGYLIKSVVENISKHTDTFGRNVHTPEIHDADININRDC